MTTYIELTEDAFAALFKPAANHLNSNASYDWGDGYGTFFETYGDELAYVQSQPPANVWTLITGDGGDYVVSGYHLVNRFGYFISTLPVPDGVTIQVELEGVDEHELPLLEIPPVSPTIIASIRNIVDYQWHDEERHFLEECAGETSEPREVPHIFDSLRSVRNWLNDYPQ